MARGFLYSPLKARIPRAMPPKSRPKRPGGRRWDRTVKAIVQRDFGRCHLCGHYGGKSADHIVPCSADDSKFWSMANLKCAHAYPNGCTECTFAAGYPIYCNEIRQDDDISKGRKRIELKTGLDLSEDQGQASEGRNWLVSVTN